MRMDMQPVFAHCKRQRMNIKPVHGRKVTGAGIKIRRFYFGWLKMNNGFRSRQHILNRFLEHFADFMGIIDPHGRGRFNRQVHKII